MNKHLLASLSVAGLILAWQTADAAPPTPYAGVPAGFDYPADKAVLEGYRKAQNTAALRHHGWMLFAGATQQAADGTPNWETWYREVETFRPAGPIPQGPRKVTFPFRVPRQFKKEGIVPQSPGQSLLTFVLFNQETYDHIRDPSAPLFQRAELDKLKGQYPANTPWDQRTIPPFTARSMSLKTAWWPVAGDKLTKLPVWDNSRADPTHPHGFDKWTRVVAVDGTRQHVPAGETTAQFPMPQHPTTNIFGRDKFYLVPVDSEIIQAAQGDTGLRIAVNNALGRDFKLGDFVAFLGFHMTTKEIDDWTWATFWWHDDPDNNPFGKDRPVEVRDVWRNYVMAVADDQVTPNEPDGSPHIAYNPWLEGPFAAGITSNCMTCHHRAAWPPVPFLPITRGAADPAHDLAYQGDRLRSDFLWSIPFNAGP